MSVDNRQIHFSVIVKTRLQIRKIKKSKNEEHGIKLSNPSNFIKNAVKSKKVFQVSKTGTEAHYKLTREAEDEMKTILSSN